ncbi:hypothetical protein [Paludibaculum fermentans]|uniref:hypothetical protein n=1 Tax=Paludibaculum fermentans TaxID=1473598 RepID=UPI003EC1063D
MACTIEIAIPLQSEGLPDAQGLADADRMERLFLDMLARRTSVDYQGHEIGGGTLVLYFEVARPRPFLKACELLALRHEMKDIRINLRDIADDCRSGVSFALFAYEEGLTTFAARPGKRSRKPKIGDYYAIPLPDGRWGHAWFVAHEAPWGDFVQVLDVILAAPCEMPLLSGASALFPPIGSSVVHSVKGGKWKFLGNCPPEPVPIMPLMRSSTKAACDKQPGQYGDWVVSNSLEWRVVGTLPEELRTLEFKAGWKPEQIAQRIMTGVNIYSVYY